MSGWQAGKRLLAPWGWRLLRDTLRMPTPPTAATVIYACLHRDILPALVHVRPVRPVLLVSRSPDGELLVRALGARDYDYVRGAAGEDGGAAFGALRRALDAGRPVGVAVDGPRGPFGVVRGGVLQLARLSGRPIVGLRARCPLAMRLRTWDRTVVPWPGSRVRIDVGPPLGIARAAGAEDLVRARRALAAWFREEEAR